MFRRTAFAAAIALALVAPAVVAAQTCQGYASYASGSVQIGAGADFVDGANVYGAGIGVGKVNGGFVNGLIGMADYEDTSESSTVFGISGGWQMPLGAASNAFQLCPVASFTYLSGPNNVDFFGTEVDLSGRDLTFGLSVGTAITSSPALSIVPFGAVSFVNSAITIEGGGEEETLDGNAGLLDLGLGFVANQWITIRPSVAIPFAEEDDAEGDEVFSIRFAFNFGGGAR